MEWIGLRRFKRKAKHMKGRVVIRRNKRGAEREKSLGVSQPFLWPADLFSRDEAGSKLVWTCVRTRPKWEKKFVKWLMESRKTCFLPVFRRETKSGRKRRISEIPLFSGFVFVGGEAGKKEFTQTGSVAYVLKPRSAREAEQLGRELRDIWSGLTSGLYVTPVQNLASGETCRIVHGPLQGVEAKFERKGREGRLILQVERMGGGVAVEIPADGVEVCP